MSDKKKKTCGIIMPISPHPDYPIDHWEDVLNILREAILQTEFEPKLVSDDVAIGLIHDRIVTNLYHNDIVVCDVSSKNPNVMFELGLRLAFDKPTIIIKDESTGYSFDTGVIEHIPYPSSLRFGQIVTFKEDLIKRINATYERSTNEPSYSPFLKSFGQTIKPATIDQTEITEGKYILTEIEALRQEFRIMRLENKNLSATDSFYGKPLVGTSLINSILSKYRLKPDTQEIEFSSVFLNAIRNDFLAHGIEMPNSDFTNLVTNYFKKPVVTR